MREAASAVLEHEPVIVAYLFDSRARGDHRPDSDADIAVRRGLSESASRADLISMRRNADSLAGRAETVTLHGLSQGEVTGSGDQFTDVLFPGNESRLAAVHSDLRAGTTPSVPARAHSRRRMPGRDAHARHGSTTTSTASWPGTPAISPPRPTSTGCPD